MAPDNGTPRACAQVMNGSQVVTRGFPPTVNEYRNAVKAFLEYDDPAQDGPDLKDVQAYTAWNEPNLPGYQPTAATSADRAAGTDPAAFMQYAAGGTDVGARKAFLAGRYWRSLNALCAAKATPCTAAAGDFSDGRMDNVTRLSSNGAKYFTHYRKGMGRGPGVWAWHSYLDNEDAVVRPTVPKWHRFRALLQRTGASSKVWLTEQGVRIVRTNAFLPGRYPVIGGEIMRKMLDEFAVQSPRIDRFYYYQLIGEAKNDSGLVDWNGRAPRPYLYDAYKCRTTWQPTC